MMFSVIIPTIDAKREWLEKALSSCSFADEIIITRRIGLTQAVNEAVDKARGEYIAILPDDDYYLPEIENALMLCDSDIIHFPCRHQIEDGEPYGLFDVSPDVTLEQNERGNIIHGSSFIRREVFKSLGGYIGTICMDADLWNRALRAGHTFRYHPEPSVVFRWNKRSRMQTMAFGCGRQFCEGM